MSFGMENWSVQTGVFLIWTLYGGVVVLSVLLHWGRTTSELDLKEEDHLSSSIGWNWPVAVELQSV